MNLLTAIHNCSGKEDETFPAFVTRFMGTVARYKNHTAGVSDGTSRQVAILMLRDVHLTADTMNSLLFQLTTSAAFNEMDHLGQVLATNAELMLMLELLKSSSTLKEEAAKSLQLKVQDEAKKIQDQRFRNVPMFTLPIAAEYFSHVKGKQQQDLSTSVTKQHGSMLGKWISLPLYGGRRDIKRLKEETNCRVCDKHGH